MRVIFYDLETTGLRPTSGIACAEIVQIGAISTDAAGTDKIFNWYILPTNMRVEEDAFRVHGLSDQVLEQKFHNGEALLTVEGLGDFMTYIEAILKEDPYVVLVAHNNHKFDFPILANNLINHHIQFPCGSVKLFDSLDLMKKVQASDSCLTKINLNACLDFFFGVKQANPHNALTDAKYVKRVCDAAAKKLGYVGGLESFLVNNQNLMKEWPHREAYNPFNQ